MDTTKPRLFADTVARPVLAQGTLYGWYLMNNQRDGWSAYGMPYRSIDDIASAFDVRIGKPGVDEHGDYVEVLRKKGGA